MSEADDGDVLCCGDIDTALLEHLLAGLGLDVGWTDDGGPVPGARPGAPGAGLVGPRLYLRRDTPVHAALHQAGRYACADAARRAGRRTDAGGTALEERAVCYLQIVLADELPDVGRERMQRDMDASGYVFGIGSARAWFEGDAEDARDLLIGRNLIGALMASRRRGPPAGGT